MEQKQFWIVGHMLDDSGSAEGGMKWRYCGLFSTEKKAREIAIEHDDFFIGPADLDCMSAANNEEQSWPDCYYPALETKAEANARAEEGTE